MVFVPLKRLAALAVLLIFVVTLVLATVHASQTQHKNHQAANCALCLFRQSTRTTVMPPVTAIINCVILIAVASSHCFLRKVVQSIFLAANGPRAPPLS
jgi:hypothetical protein